MTKKVSFLSSNISNNVHLVLPHLPSEEISSTPPLWPVQIWYSQMCKHAEPARWGHRLSDNTNMSVIISVLLCFLLVPERVWCCLQGTVIVIRESQRAVGSPCHLCSPSSYPFGAFMSHGDRVPHLRQPSSLESGGQEISRTFFGTIARMNCCDVGFQTMNVIQSILRMEVHVTSVRCHFGQNAFFSLLTHLSQVNYQRGKDDFG